MNSRKSRRITGQSPFPKDDHTSPNSCRIVAASVERPEELGESEHALPCERMGVGVASPSTVLDRIA